MERVYGELERYAERQMKVRFGGNLAGLTLEPTALVNETYLRLLRQPLQFENRRHFFVFTTKVMLAALRTTSGGAARRNGAATGWG